jgi:hypothetical protein
MFRPSYAYVICYVSKVSELKDGGKKMWKSLSLNLMRKKTVM